MSYFESIVEKLRHDKGLCCTCDKSCTPLAALPHGNAGKTCTLCKLGTARIAHYLHLSCFFFYRQDADCSRRCLSGQVADSSLSVTFCLQFVILENRRMEFVMHNVGTLGHLPHMAV